MFISFGVGLFCWETGSNRQGKAKQKDQKTRNPPTGYPLVLLVLFGLCLTAASVNRKGAKRACFAILLFAADAAGPFG